MPYTIQLEKSVLKFLKKLSKSSIREIGEAIDLLKHNPRPHGYKKLKGNDNLYRIRAGDYRIVYQIHNKQLLVLVIRIGDRKYVYRNLG